MPERKTYFNWSSGKDSALALYYLLRDKRYSVEYLLTNINRHHDRVSMHGLRTLLLQRQLDAAGIDYGWLELPEIVSHDEYEARMSQKVIELKDEGFEYAGFGDIFLEDLRTYREQQLDKWGMKTLFPLWGRNTRELTDEFFDLGFKVVVICVDAGRLDRSFTGREFDRSFIRDLPAGVDPCGENGEFHTFCYDAPYFNQPVHFEKGGAIFRAYSYNGMKSGFWFCDLF